MATLAVFDRAGLVSAPARFRERMHVLRAPSGHIGVGFEGAGEEHGDVLATLPPLYPEWLGDRAFNEVHGVRFPYVAGAMANGIATAELVVAMSRAGMLGFFGAAGLTPDRVQTGVEAMLSALGPDAVFGANLIHSPNEPSIEANVAELFIRRGVRFISASAYMALTLPLVRVAASGLRQTGDGAIVRRHHVFAKISRPEVAARFMQPAPDAMLDELARRGEITADEARLARLVPVAEDITVEADSGGHTDNQALTAVFPVVCSLRDRIQRERGYARPIRVGAAGGLGTPRSVAAAFSLGAAYVLTGSVNQSAIESGLSDAGKALLAQAGMGDVMMAPAADMFEMGVEVQVLKRGTMFGPRASRLYELYVGHPSLDAIPADVVAKLEREVLGLALSEVRAATRAFWAERDPHENERAAGDPKHEMALVFRWYLGLSSRWAIVGDPKRRLDYQIWCGPAMGAFNDWVRGSFLEPPEARTVDQIALNLMEGAAHVTRAHQLRTAGAPIPDEAFDVRPRPLA